MNKRVAVITGGASGIGLATARMFAANGYAAAILDLRSTSDAEEVVRSSGGKFSAVDVGDFENVAEAVTTNHDNLGSIDVLVNSAGISKDSPVGEMSEEFWDAVIRVDLKGTFNTIRAVAPYFQRRNAGKIVNVASTLALRSRKNFVNYIAAKSGVIGLTKGAARDLGKYNVNVNAVAPGLVETPSTAGMPPDIKDKLRAETALGRLASPEDVAGVVYFLCTDAARHITGETIRVDGGQLS